MGKTNKSQAKLEAKIKKYKQDIEKTHKKSSNEAPSFLRRKLSVEPYSIKGFPCYRLKKNGTFPDVAVFYIYGGSLVHPIQNDEWAFLQDLVMKTEAEFVVPMYPLAPEYGCEEVFEMLLPAYNEASKDAHYKDIILMGGGSGSGIALSIMLQIWKEGYKNPTKLILLSPILDAQFREKSILNKLQENGINLETFYKEERREFLRRYWIRNYEGRGEYVSPIHEDLTDLCDNIFVASGTNDIYNLYARMFCDKIHASGKEVMFFEYKDAKHDFYLDEKLSETIHLKKMLHDVILGTDTQMIRKYMEGVRQHAEWSKWFPEVFMDERAVRYASLNKLTSRSMKKRNMKGLIGATEQQKFDEMVRLFLMEYPEGTVIYLGCGLDTMFERVDNGRVNWYNLDSPGVMSIRALYAKRREREYWIGRSLTDSSWMREIHADMDKGILFVCHNHFQYMKKYEVREFLQSLYKNYQGCDVLFDVSSKDAIIYENFLGSQDETKYRIMQFSMEDPKSELEMMNPAYNIVEVRNIWEGISKQEDWSAKLKGLFMISSHRQSHRIVHLRLGYEKYMTYDDKNRKKEHRYEAFHGVEVQDGGRDRHAADTRSNGM